MQESIYSYMDEAPSVIFYDKDTNLEEEEPIPDIDPNNDDLLYGNIY